MIALLLAAAACSALSSGTPADRSFLAAKVVPASAGAGSYCAVEGRTEGTITFELRLPESWNGKLLFQGYGGLDGAPPAFTQTLTIGSPGSRLAIERGYAVVTTDTGHRLPNGRTDVASYGDWAIDDQQARINWAHRSTHVVLAVAKRVVARYYGKAARYAYYQGCSGGGRQAAMVAQRYPRDFDGVVSGAPWLKPSGQVVAMNQQLAAADTLAPKLRLIADAMIRSCDANDGVTDGLIADPSQCAQDPAALRCKSGDAPDCLTAEQVASLRVIYGGATDVQGTGTFPGYARGGEGGWVPAIVPREGERSSNDLLQRAFFRGFVFGDGYERGPLPRDSVPWVPAGIARLVDVKPDFSAFRAAGGKLLMWHGWHDARLSPFYTVQFYTEARRALGGGASRMDDFFRLFMAPGVAHCNGGPGPNTFDALVALEQWVEQGVAPDRIVATGVTEAGEKRTRPLCPYPQQPVYAGHGSTDDAASFACRASIAPAPTSP